MTFLLKKYILSLIYLLVVIASINNKVYSQFNVEKIDNYNDSIKTIAIMPYKLYVGRNGLKTDTTASMEKEATIMKAFYLQNKLYEWFIIKQKKCKVTIQDVHKTDSLLKKTKLPLDDLFRLNEAALCQYLGVDAITYSEIRMSNPTFDVASEIRKDVLLGAASAMSGGSIFHRADNNKTTYGISIYDVSGEEVWKYTSIDTDWADNAGDKLSQRFIEQVAINLPFVKH